MSTGIEWAEEVWNPIVGCSLVSPGCTNCYAMTWAARLQHMKLPAYQGVTQRVNGHDVWTGQLNLQASVLHKPLNRKKPTTYFVNSMGDLFHEDVPEAWIDLVFDVMRQCPQHIFLILTKRPERMRRYVMTTFYQTPCPLNIWLGISAEDQARFEARHELMLTARAANWFVSAEPLLGPLHIGKAGDWCRWLIAGGESGPGARAVKPAWVQSLRDQCAEQQIDFTFKQWGEWAPTVSGDMRRVGKKRAGRRLDGVMHDYFPKAGGAA